MKSYRNNERDFSSRSSQVDFNSRSPQSWEEHYLIGLKEFERLYRLDDSWDNKPDIVKELVNIDTKIFTKSFGLGAISTFLLGSFSVLGLSVLDEQLFSQHNYLVTVASGIGFLSSLSYFIFRNKPGGYEYFLSKKINALEKNINRGETKKDISL